MVTPRMEPETPVPVRVTFSQAFATFVSLIRTQSVAEAGPGAVGVNVKF